MQAVFLKEVAMSGNGESSGRKRVNRVEQALPLIVSGAKSRTVERVAMSAQTAREARAYTKWAAKLLNMDEEEVMVLTADRAFGDLLKRDELWQKQKDQVDDDQSQRTSPGPAAPPPAARPPVAPPAPPASNGVGADVRKSS
jgi:hypothetical protein